MLAFVPTFTVTSPVPPLFCVGNDAVLHAADGGARDSAGAEIVVHRDVAVAVIEGANAPSPAAAVMWWRNC